MPSLPALNELVRARASARARSVVLSDGVTVYDVHGETGPWLVLLHGVWTPMVTWDRLVPLLAGAGFRVLRYDAYGAGLSDRPRVAYDGALYVRQLRELLDALSIPSATLVGWSLGAATSVRFAREHPGRVERLALIAPALLVPRPPPALGFVFRARWFSELLERTSGLITLAAAQRQLAEPLRHPRYLGRMLEQRRFAGLGAALASALEHFPWDYGRDLPNHAIDIPTLLVWGRQDPTVPFSMSARVAKLFAYVESCVIERGRHAPHYDHAEQVGSAIRSFASRAG